MEEVRQGGHEGPTRVEGAPRGVGTPPCLVASSMLPLHGLQVSQVAFLPKISSVKFQVNWTPFDFPFLQYSKTRKKQKRTEVTTSKQLNKTIKK